MVSVFKRPKNREDSSKFDDFWTKRIVSARPISGKIFERTKRTKSFRKIRKFFNFFFEKFFDFFFGKFLAYIRETSLLQELEKVTVTSPPTGCETINDASRQFPVTTASDLYLSENGRRRPWQRRRRRIFLKTFRSVRSLQFFSRNRSCRCDSIGPKIVKIGAILAIFWPFEVGGANFYWSQLFRDVVNRPCEIIWRIPGGGEGGSAKAQARSLA